MEIKFTADGGGAPHILATDTRGTGKWVGPDNLRRDGQRVVQTLQPVGANRVTHHSRKNRSGSISFTAKHTCAGEAAAVKLTADYDNNLPLGRGTLAIGAEGITGAIIQSVSTRHTGVTVHADITIVF
jgi:hypothetical protein